jgi:hypothetical protein
LKEDGLALVVRGRGGDDVSPRRVRRGVRRQRCEKVSGPVCFGERIAAEAEFFSGSRARNAPG